MLLPTTSTSSCNLLVCALLLLSGGASRANGSLPGGIRRGLFLSSVSEYTKEGRANYVRNLPRMAPSSMGLPSAFEKLQADEKNMVFCNRPPSAAHLVPPTLLHPIIGEFF